MLFSLVFGLFLFSGIALAQTPNPTPTPNPNIETDANQAPVPGIDAVVDLLGGDPNVSGSNPIGDDDVFSRANSPQDLGFMKIMWDLTRKMSNVIVVVAFFMAAVATTLNFQISTYGIKKTLPSVLLATLYANFSYAIAQVFNNINHAIFNAFTGNANSAAQLMANFIKGPLDNQWSGINLEAGWDNIQAIIVLVFMVVLALGLWLLVFLFYIRNYILAMLVAIAPLAFMSLALPFTASAFRKWWDQFIKWTFFPAVAGFWLYLGAVALLAMGTTGGLVALVFTGLILWTAIRTPFTLGGGVGAVAGFITGNQLSQAAVKNAKLQGAIVAQNAPILGSTLRGFSTWGKINEARLKEAQSGGVMKRRVAPKLVQKGDWADSFRYLNYLRKGLGHIGTLGFAHDLVAKNVNKLAFGKIGKLQEQASVADEEVSHDVEEGKRAQREDASFKARVGELNAAKQTLSETMSAIAAEAEEGALASNKMLREERELARQRKTIAENMKNTLINDLAGEGANRETDLHKKIQARLGAQIKRSGYANLAEAMASTSNNSRISAEQLQTVLDEQNLNAADRNVMNHQLIMDLAKGKINPSQLNPAQTKELEDFLARELGNDGLSLSTLKGPDGLIENARRYQGESVAGTGYNADSAEAKRMLIAGKRRSSFIKKYMGFQGEFSGKRQEVQMKYFEPGDWQSTVQEINRNTVNAFLQNETQLGSFVDKRGRPIKGDTDEEIEQHHKIIRDLHDRFNAALRTIKTADYSDENFLRSVEVLAQMFEHAGMPFSQDFQQEIGVINDNQQSEQNKRRAQGVIRRTINNDNTLVQNQVVPAGGQPKTVVQLIAATGISNKSGKV